MSLLGKKFLLGLVLAILILPSFAFSRLGVGVGIGKIKVDKPLKAGMIYDLPYLPVLNTGDEAGKYETSIEYHEGQEQNPKMGLKPAKEWFRFEPQSFNLEPGQVQNVRIILALPTKVQPGNYFAYLEVHPLKKSEGGQTVIGIAVATKLYFTVAPANIFEGIYYRFISLYSRYHPWNTIILLIIALVIIFRFLTKRFKFQLVKK